MSYTYRITDHSSIRPATLKFRRLYSLVFAVVISISGCATNPVTGEQDLVFMSEAQEIALGNQASQQISQQYRPYLDQDLQNYVNEVGQRLAAKSHRSNLNFSFTLLDSTQINAFALPGGHIYITRGLLAYLNSEAEMAAVLGHEIGHVTARHSVRQQSSHQAAGIGVGLLGILLPGMSNPAVSQVVNVAGAALLSGYGREHELESDRLGAEYLANVGYDPTAMLDVVRALKNQELFDQKLAALEGRQPRRYHGLFATHPDNDTRLQEAINYVSQQKTTADEIGRERFLDRIDGMLFGENPDEGVIKSNQFLHPQLGFAVSFPAQWRIQNLPDRVVALSPDNSVQLQMTLVSGAGDATAAQIAKNLGIQSLSNAQKIGQQGFDGITGLTAVKTDAGQMAARVSVIKDGGNGFVFTGIGKNSSALAKHDQNLIATAHSFRRLSNEERTDLKPRRIRVVRLKGDLSWASLAQISPLETLAEDQLRLLNADGREGLIPASRRIKVIE
ncbi:MAG: M48 family metalloprotease [Gammaproteobacteria bacterium]